MLSIHDDMTIKWYNDGDRYCLHIRQDYMPDDPREQDDDGRVTIMACWHSRYGLGDDIGKVDPDEFWRELVRKNVPESEILDAAEAGKLNGIRIAKNLEGENLVDIYETVQWRTVLGNSEPEEILEYEGVLRDAAAEYLMDALTIGHCQTLMQPYAEWLPLWLYDHSGITMSCGTCAYPYSDRWDSGQVGFIIVLKDRIVSARCLDPNDDGWREMAIEEMTAEVRTYDEYLTGDVYWFQVHKFVDDGSEDGDWDEIDSYGGFYGYDLVENGMLDSVGYGLDEAIKNDEYEVGQAQHHTYTYVEF